MTSIWSLFLQLYLDTRSEINIVTSDVNLVSFSSTIFGSLQNFSNSVLLQVTRDIFMIDHLHPQEYRTLLLSLLEQFGLMRILQNIRLRGVQFCN